MKKILSILLLVICVKGFSQAPTISQQKLLFGKIDTVVTNYVNFSSFLLPGKSNVTENAVNNFKSLFVPGIKLPNEMIPAYFYGDTIKPASIVIGSVDDYTSGILKNFSDGLRVTLLYTDVNITDVANKTAKVLVVKRLEGFSADSLNLQNQDTVVLNLKISDDYSKVQIASEEVLGYAFTSSNDYDNDFIADSKDRVPKKYNVNRWVSTGKADGGPTDWQQAAHKEWEQQIAVLEKSKGDLKRKEDESSKKISALDGGIARLDKLIASPPHFWIGGGAHAGIISSSLSNTTGLLNSQTLNTTFSGSSAFGGDIQLAYYFGKTASFGISAGASYTSFSGKLTDVNYSSTINNAVDPNANRAIGGGVNYIQQISMTDPSKPIVENVTLSQFSIPLTLVYKGKFSDNFGFQLEAGVAYNLQYSGSMGSSTGAAFDYEAIYNYQTTGNYKPNTGSNISNQYFEITKAMAAKYYGATTTALQQAYLNSMGAGRTDGYPVGSGITGSPSQTTATFSSGSLGFLLRSGVTYYFDPQFTVSAQVYFESSSFTNATSSYSGTNYQLVGAYNAGKPLYNTLLNGAATMANTQVGLKVSVAHALFYNVAKWKTDADGLQKNLNSENANHHAVQSDLMDVQNRLNKLKSQEPEH